MTVKVEATLSWHDNRKFPSWCLAWHYCIRDTQKQYIFVFLKKKHDSWVVFNPIYWPSTSIECLYYARKILLGLKEIISLISQSTWLSSLAIAFYINLVQGCIIYNGIDKGYILLWCQPVNGWYITVIGKQWQYHLIPSYKRKGYQLSNVVNSYHAGDKHAWWSCSGFNTYLNLTCLVQVSAVEQVVFHLVLYTMKGGSNPW